MKEQLSKEWKLGGYGFEVKTQRAFCIIFFIVGTILKLFPVETDHLAIDAGAVFLFSSAMFPAQLVMSLDMSQMVQVSPYKKKLQTSIPAKMTTAGVMIMLGWGIFLQMISCAITGKNFADQGVKLLMTGMWAFVVLFFTGVCYKFFVVSMIIMYILVIGAGLLVGIVQFLIPKGFIHPLVAIVADIVLVLTGGVIQYGLMKLFYKFPLSKAAFGAAIKREMNA